VARIVLIGPPAAGKTKLGRVLAWQLGVKFIDTDRKITAKHGPIPDIFAQLGEAQFRAWEREEVVDALKHDAVVSLGGGAIVNEDTQRDLEQERVLLLTTTPEAVASRLGGDRPLSSDLDRWVQLVTERMPIYQRLADYTIDTSAKPAVKIIAEASAWAEGRLEEQA